MAAESLPKIPNTLARQDFGISATLRESQDPPSRITRLWSGR